MPVISLDLDSSDAVSGLKKYDSAVDNSQKKTNSAFAKMRSSAKSIGTAVAAAVAAVGVAAAIFASKAVTMASSMVETQGVFEQAFAGMTTVADAWAKDLGDNYHLSELVAKQSLNTFQLVLTGMGVATAEAGKMSYALVKVGSDLGAAFDRDTVDVVNDVRSALSGSMEVMDKYGIVIRAAQVEAKALEMGLAKTKDGITQAHKATATYALIMEKASTVTGTTAREAKGYAGQLKEAKKNIDNLTIALGTKMLPAFTQALTEFNNWITTGDRVNTIINTMVEGVRFLVNGFYGLEVILEGTIVIIAKLAEGFIKLATPMKWVLDAMVAVGTIDSNPIADLQDVMEEFTASAVEGVGTTLDKIDAFNKSMDRIKSKVETTTTSVVTGSKASVIATDNVKKSLDKEFNAITLVDGKYILKESDSVAAQGATKDATDEVTTALDKEFEAITLVNGVYTLKEEASLRAQDATKKAADASTDWNLRQTRSLQDVKDSLDQYGERVISVSGTTVTYLEKVGGKWLKMTETVKDTKPPIDAIKDSVDSASIATDGLAKSFDKVKTAADSAATAAQRTSATAEGTYEASAAWSGGTKSAGSAPAMTQAEMDYINTRTAQGAAGSVNSKLSSFVTSNDRDRWASMDSLQLSSRADALQDVYDARDANGGAPVTNIMNIFNQNVSSSDVTNIIEEQQRQEART